VTSGNEHLRLQKESPPWRGRALRKGGWWLQHPVCL